MVAALYDAVCDTLQAGENYPGWEKGEYPTRQDAEEGEAAGELFVAEDGGKIIGTMMLREEQEPAARSARWQQALAEEEQLTIYTFAVLPERTGQGVGKALLDVNKGQRNLVWGDRAAHAGQGQFRPHQRGGRPHCISLDAGNFHRSG